MKEVNNFLITGFGRSGTKFLSSVMNRSKNYTVNHEPRGDEDETRIQPTPTLLKDFSQDFYGEVNSRMRFNFWDVEVAKRGIIFRNTKDIVLSIANRNNFPRTMELIEELNNWYKEFYDWLQSGEVVAIDFERMTTDKDYLKSVLKYFGITDVDLSKVDLSIKVNKNKFISFTSFDLLPLTMIQKYESYEW